MIAPQMPASLDRIAGTLGTPRGEITVALTRDGETVRAEVTIPAGTTAIFRYGDSEKVLCGGENPIECRA